MFLGEYEHSLDAKGRLAIPAKFRLRLGDGAVITRGLDGCLIIYPAEKWLEMASRLDARPLPTRQPVFIRGLSSLARWSVILIDRAVC